MTKSVKFSNIEQLELLILVALAALASDDFVDETEYLKLLTMVVIVSSCCHEDGVFHQSKEFDPRKFLRGLSHRTLILYSLALAALPIHFLDRSAVLVFQVRRPFTAAVLKHKSATRFVFM